jgi:hypothetical protein
LLKEGATRMKEVWKDVVGFEGFYQISNLGRLKSFKKKKEGKILSNKNSKGGYFSVVLQKCINKRHTRIHRLVIESFKPNYENKPEVNHIDGNRQNNNINNLEWSTRKENARHAIENGFANYKSMNFYNTNIRPKKILQFDLKGSFINIFNNSKEAYRKT